MLLFDGHISHSNREFLQACLDYKVLPVCLPPHTTHFSQPLDVSIFSPLKAAYSNILHRRSQAGERGVWKGNFYTLLTEAQTVAFTPENIRSGFWHTGHVPLDFEVIRRTLNFPTTVSINNQLTPAGPFQYQPLQPLISLSPTEVYAITTPRNHRALHHLTESLSLDLQHSNSPKTWRIRHAVEKITNSSISTMHERDYLQERLRVATEHRKPPEVKPRRRRRIPEEGLIFRNKAEIQQHFDGLQAKSKEVQSSKLQKLKEKAEKLDVRIRELYVKKEKHRALEKERKLPTTWRSVARLEEDEQKEVDRLQKIREDIHDLEQELEEGSEREREDGGQDENESDREELYSGF